MENDNKELTVLKGQISKLENKANAVEIKTSEDYADAIDLVSKLKDTATTIKNKKEAITKPLNEALRNARSLFAPIELQYENAERIIKTKLQDYKRKIDDEARAKEAKIAADLEAGKIKKLETAEKKIENIERIENTTKGKTGELQIRKVKKVKIINELLIPREYLEPNMVAIRRDALAGKQIAGIEVYEEESMAVY